MPAMNTDQLLSTALDLVGWSETPLDCAIHHPGTRINHVLLGLDVDAGMLFMARQLGYHAVIACQASGTGALWDLYAQNRKYMIAAGVLPDAADAALQPGSALLHVQSLETNYDRLPSVARLLDQPFMSIRSPFAELSRRLIQEQVNAAVVGKLLARVGDIHDALMALPSFVAAKTEQLAPVNGWDVPAGKAVVAPLGSDLHVVKAYLAHGADTVCCMDLPSEDVAYLLEEGPEGNILLLGRLASLSAGIVPYAAALRAQGIEVSTFAGIIGDKP